MHDVEAMHADAAVSVADGVAAVLLATATDLVGITDEYGCLRFVNGAARSVLGFEPSEMVGSAVFDYIHPDEVDDAIRSLASTVDRHERHAVPLLVRVRAKDGSWRALEVTATNLLDDPVVHGMVFNCRDLSDRSGSLRRWKLMFEQSAVAQSLIVPNQVGVIANATFARLFGTSREELLTTAPEMLVHPDDRQSAVGDRVLLEAGETPRVFVERRYVRTDGEVFVGRAATTALYDLDGNFEYLFSTIEDVTVQVEAAEALARSEARARALVDNSPDIVAVLYPDGDWAASDQGTRLLGYPKGYNPDGGVFSLIHPDDIAVATVALSEVLAGTRPPGTPIELRFRAADGSYRQFECVGQNLSDDTHIGGVVVTARDVTERKHAEARLRAAEERFKVAFEHAPICVSLIDLDGAIIDINTAGAALMGSTRVALIGTSAETCVHPDDRAISIEATVAQLDGSEAPVEFRLLRPDGHTITVLSHASLIMPGDDEQPPYVVTLQADISDRKRLEHELERLATHDPLTGLRNRTALTEHLEYVLHRRNGPRVVALFVDLDNFKTINDGHGHEIGDHVLVAVAQHISATLRAGDIAARIGGDEFVVICDIDNEPDHARDIAERLRVAIAQPAEQVLGQPVITASIGVALAEPGDNPASLLRRADAATYIAKRAGKGRVELSASRSEATQVSVDSPPSSLK